MNRLVSCFLLLVSFFYNCLPLSAQTSQREMLFDDDWLFFRGAALGADKTDYDDGFWRKVDLPHDWSIEDLPNTNSPFDMGAISQVNGGFTTGGTGWYRKHFKVPAQDKGQRFLLQFDGVYMDADFYLNGKKIGTHPYGYTSHYFDITSQLKTDGENILAVKVQNEGVNSRWYSGSGIYRHVWLKALSPLHLMQWGTGIITNNITSSSADVNIQSIVLNESSALHKAKIVTSILDAKGVKVATNEMTQLIVTGKSFAFHRTLKITKPELWDIETPTLYTAVTKVFSENDLVDEIKEKFGIRSISVDAVNGFRLNGKTVKLKGGCVHHDNGPLGAKAYDRAEERKVELLKAAGYNAIRTSHNPPSPAFLDACDRLGMLVIDEAFDCWNIKKNASDYHLYFNDWWQRDIASMIMRDRNHPSIIMWSTGNEIPNRDKPEVVAISQKLTDYVKLLDSTRFVTCGVNGVEPNKDPFFATLDVAGYNYAPQQYVPDHQRLPNRVMMATESFPLTAYDYWMGVEDNPWVIGDFVWTAFDYIGEASIGWLGYPQRQAFYPWNLAYCGDIDVCGWKRPQSYYRDALWKKDQLSLFVKAPKPSFDTAAKKEAWSQWEWQDVVSKWDWKGYENKPLQVVVYSSCEAVELFVNGKSLGKKITSRVTKYTAEFTVPYQAGELKVIGYADGKKVNTSVLQTPGKPVSVRLTADRNTIDADGQDLSYVTVEVIDSKGNVVPNAEPLVQFSIAGAGTIVGVGNANPRSIESCVQPQRKAWQGKCLLIVKSQKKASTITINAKATGLQPGKLIINSK
jgi:beta-galactosidase